MRPTHIHHINFLVRDLETAVTQFEKLGIGPFVHERLDGRKVRTARAQVGDSWFALVQPLDEDSIPARHLAENGEGFFLLSLGVESLDDSIGEMKTQSIRFVGDPRDGVAEWRVADIDPTQTQGIQIQLTEDQ